jgi:aphidicolan-16beta-ol synthase/syn-copalyl-diphosphate synthase
METVVNKELSAVDVRSIITELFDDYQEIARKDTQSNSALTVSKESLRSSSYMYGASVPVHYRIASAVQQVVQRLQSCFWMSNTKYRLDGNEPGPQDTGKPPKAPRDEVFDTLKEFTLFVLNHPEIQNAAIYDQRRLKQELQTFLLGHVKQAEDSQRFSSRSKPTTNEEQLTFANSPSSFLKWVRTTAAEHTSCPYSFSFLTCLATSCSATNGFDTAETRYIAQDLCSHLAAMCRLYNDYGSIVRDEQEGNLNSRNFPEFEVGVSPAGGDADGRKKSLWKVAEYERRCLDQSFQNLKEHLLSGKNERLIVLLQMFVNVTDTYGQIYVVRDIGVKTAL